MISFSSHARYAGSRLRLHGDNLDQKSIDILCSVKPDRFFNKGDPIKGTDRVRSTGMWSVRANSNTGSFSDDIEHFVRIFPESALPLRGNFGIDTVTVSIDIDEDRDESSFELIVEPIDLENILRLGARLYVTYLKLIDQGEARR